MQHQWSYHLLEALWHCLPWPRPPAVQMPGVRVASCTLAGVVHHTLLTPPPPYYPVIHQSKYPKQSMKSASEQSRAMTLPQGPPHDCGFCPGGSSLSLPLVPRAQQEAYLHPPPQYEHTRSYLQYGLEHLPSLKAPLRPRLLRGSAASSRWIGSRNCTVGTALLGWRVHSS